MTSKKIFFLEAQFHITVIAICIHLLSTLFIVTKTENKSVDNKIKFFQA